MVDRRRRGRRPGVEVLISDRFVRQHLAVPDHQQAGADDAGFFDVLLECAAKHRDTWRGSVALAFERDVAAGKHDDDRDKPHQPGGPEHLRQYKRGLCSSDLEMSLDADIDAQVDGLRQPKCRTLGVIEAPRRGTRFDTETTSPSQSASIVRLSGMDEVRR